MAINKEIGIRIAAARKEKGLSAVQLSKLTGFSCARISHWEQGRRLPNLESVLVLERFLSVPAAYLLCIDDVIDSEISNKDQSNVVIYSFPVYKITDVDKRTPLWSMSVAMPYDLGKDTLFAVKLVDDSMGSEFSKGDIVLFSEQKEAYDGSLVLLKINKTGQILFRKYIIDHNNIENPIYKITPLNKNYDNILAESIDLFTILGVHNSNGKLFF